MERRKFAKIVGDYLNDLKGSVIELREAVATGQTQTTCDHIKEKIKLKVKSLKTFSNSNFQYSGMTRQLISEYRLAFNEPDFLAATRRLN